MINDVRLFHQTFGHPIQEKPTIPSKDRQLLRNKLIRDEYIGEFDPAWAKCLALSTSLSPREQASPGGVHDTTDALAELGDVIADLIYYLIGTALEYGLPLDQIWDAVQKANMSKLWTYKEAEHLPDGWKAEEFSDLPADQLVIDEKQERFRNYRVTDETGKVCKPPSWSEPNIVAIIQEAMKGAKDGR